MSSTKKRLLVLASGRGSNFNAIAEAVSTGRLPAHLSGLICNKAQAPVLELAKKWNIPAILIESRGKTKTEYESLLLREMLRHQADFVCLAGYMRLLGAEIIRAFEGRILNIHPSLLPAFPGLHPQRQALAAKVTETGCSVHWVIEEMDAGPVIERASLKILPADTEDSLSARLLPLEHETYVRALEKLLRG